jgi:hypothetical protein
VRVFGVLQYVKYIICLIQMFIISPFAERITGMILNSSHFYTILCQNVGCVIFWSKFITVFIWTYIPLIPVVSQLNPLS